MTITDPGQDQPDFLYFECPECGYTSVREDGSTATDECPRCIVYYNREVRMAVRTCRSDDVATDWDARKEMKNANH